MTVEAHPMTRRRIVVPAIDDRPLERIEFRYHSAVHAQLDATVYRPRTTPGASLPAVIMVTGYPDPEFTRRLGCAQPHMDSYVSWAELLASAGIAAVTYRNERAEDAAAVLSHVRSEAASLGIDDQRIGLWSCSGNAPTALSLLMTAPPPALRCAALCYGFLLDLDGNTAVADAARAWGFADAAAGRALSDLPQSPLLVVRAGADEIPGLNETLDRFVAAALAHDWPLSLVNVAQAPHAFDLELDSSPSRAAIRQIVGFLGAHLHA